VVTQPLACADLCSGKTAHVDCQLSAEGVSVTWLRGSRELEGGAKYQFSSEGRKHSLLIQGFEAADQGVYTCVASADAESSIDLVLKGNGAFLNPTKIMKYDLFSTLCFSV